MPCAILVALFLNEIRKKAVKHVVQTVITFLHFISWVVMAGIITGLFGSSGAINGILTSIRLPSVSPISKASTFWEFIWASDWNRTSGLPLRRAPTYCHSLSIWGKVNPSGILYKTVSDSIRVILNTPSVKLCKALKVSWLFAPANNWGMPWYYHRHLLYDHHASYVRSW